MTGHAQDDHEQVHFDNRSSNPASGSDEGLAGDLGVSSERTGPDGAEPQAPGSSTRRQAGIEGTGTRGSALDRTDGIKDTSPTEVADGPGDVSELVRDGHENPVVEDRSWDRAERTMGEPKPSPIEDEKSRRDA